MSNNKKYCSQCKRETNGKWQKCPLRQEGFIPPVKMKKCCCCDLCRSRCADNV